MRVRNMLSRRGNATALRSLSPVTVPLWVNPRVERRLCLAGIPAGNGRTAALRQLVLQAPAPVIATMLGYTHQQAARVAAEAGSPWSRYAPGDHTRPSPGRKAGEGEP